MEVGAWEFISSFVVKVQFDIDFKYEQDLDVVMIGIGNAITAKERALAKA